MVVDTFSLDEISDVDEQIYESLYYPHQLDYNETFFSS